LDAETKAHVEFETKYNALMEERKQIEDEEGQEEGSTGGLVSNAVVRGLQAQVVSLEDALSRQVAEASKAEEGSDKARADARAAAANNHTVQSRGAGYAECTHFYSCRCQPPKRSLRSQ